jgi:hypothetical protein
MSVIAALLSLALFATQDVSGHETGPQPSAARMVSGPVLFDPAAMSATSGTVGRRGVLATGSASHARTGRVQRELRVGPMAGFAVQAGAEWHYVEVVRTDGSLTGFWCGPAQAISMFGREETAGCMAPIGGDLWRYFPGRGEPWLVGWPSPTTTANTATNAFEVVDNPMDAVGPFDVDIVVRDLDARRIRLEAQGRRGDRTVVFWRGEFDWSGDMAVLPLWTHRLTLRRQGQSVSASLSADGDGTALPASSRL